MANRLGARHDFVRRFEFPPDWGELCLGDIACVVGGGTPKRTDSRFWANGTIPWATPTDITQADAKFISRTSEYISELGLRSSGAALLREGSILYTSRATIGAKAIARIPMATNQGFASFVPNGVHGEYLYYLLDLVTPAIRRLGAGTTFDEVSKRDIRLVRCTIPRESEEQATIARILDAVDTALERTLETVQTVYVLQDVVLDDAFTSLEAEQCRLGTFAREVRYGTSVASNDKAHGNPVLRIPNVVGDRLALNDLAFVELSRPDVERLKLADGDLLLVRTNGNPNYVGRSVVFRRPDNRAWLYASYLIRVRLKGELLPDFVNTYLGLERGRRQLLQRVTTSAGNHNINANSIRLIRLPVPPPAEQERIAELATAFRNRYDALIAMVDALKDLKKSLMHDLLTGTVRVGDVAEALAP